MHRLPVATLNTGRITVAGYAQYADRFLRSDYTRIFISGPPGAGKSTLFRSLQKNIKSEHFESSKAYLFIDGDPLWYAFRDRDHLPHGAVNSLPQNLRFKAPWRFFIKKEWDDYLRWYKRRSENEDLSNFAASQPKSLSSSLKPDQSPDQTGAYLAAVEQVVAGLDSIPLNPFLVELFERLSFAQSFVLDYMLDLQTVLIFEAVQKKLFQTSPSSLLLWLTTSEDLVIERNRSRAATIGVEDMGFRFQTIQKNHQISWADAQKSGMVTKISLDEL